MTTISDDDVISGLKTVIEADSSLYDAADKTKIMSVHTDRPPEGTRLSKLTYALVFMGPDNNEVTSTTNDLDEFTLRRAKVWVYTKQTQTQNNARLYDIVEQLRKTLKATPTLNKTGIGKAQVRTWNYHINETGATEDWVDCTVQVKIYEEL